MKLVEYVMQASEADMDVLRSLDASGDCFASTRNVDFFFRANSRESAETIAGFVNDFNYGAARIEEADGKFSVLVVVNMPVTQHLILSVSGFMVCIAGMFDAEYDGWGCPVVPKT